MKENGIIMEFIYFIKETFGEVIMNLFEFYFIVRNFILIPILSIPMIIFNGNQLMSLIPIFKAKYIIEPLIVVPLVIYLIGKLNQPDQ